MEGEQKGWASLTGQTPEEYHGYGWAKAVHPDDAAATIVAWNEAVTERKTFQFEHRLRTKSGEWRLFSIQAIPLKKRDGSIREWVGVHTDITERKRAELNIRESEERFRQLADTSPMFVFIIEPDPLAPVSYWNRTWLHYTGQTLQEAQGRAWDGIIHPDDLSVVMEHYAPAFNNQTAYLIPAVRVKRYDGEYRWHSFKGNPRYLPGGEFNGYVGVGFDIHEQKVAEELIRASEASLQVKVAERTEELEGQKNLLNNILVNSSNGISVSKVIRNESGQVIDAATIMANDAAVRYIGLPKEIYLGKTAVEIQSGIIESAYGQTCLATLQTGEPALMQYFLEATGRWLELTISRMDEDHLIHIFTDVTQIKEAQLQLERTVDELRRSNQNLEEFAHAASHDLKEPIRKIHFFTHQLKDQLNAQLHEDQVRAFGRIENATERMGNLIDDLLLYSHVSQRPIETEPVDLNQKIQRVLEDLELDVAEKKAVINVSRLPIIKGYRRQLQQLFQNLIGNAIKYSKRDVPPCIDIAARQVMEDGKAYHLIEVKDNGIGFAQEYADKIFQMFTRLHGKSDYTGTGVGLSIVKKVVENHNGFIRAESVVGEGSTFKVYLPV
jgi:PAS domain S-box-containing protein